MSTCSALHVDRSTCIQNLNMFNFWIHEERSRYLTSDTGDMQNILSTLRRQFIFECTAGVECRCKQCGHAIMLLMPRKRDLSLTDCSRLARLYELPDTQTTRCLCEIIFTSLFNQFYTYMYIFLNNMLYG